MAKRAQHVASALVEVNGCMTAGHDPEYNPLGHRVEVTRIWYKKRRKKWPMQKNIRARKCWRLE
jgi:hypothetical protein